MKVTRILFRQHYFVEEKIKKQIKKLSNYSYSKFCLENKKTTKVERQKAIKKFLDYTRN